MCCRAALNSESFVYIWRETVKPSFTLCFTHRNFKYLLVLDSFLSVWCVCESVCCARVYVRVCPDSVVGSQALLCVNAASMSEVMAVLSRVFPWWQAAPPQRSTMTCRSCVKWSCCLRAPLMTNSLTWQNSTFCTKLQPLDHQCVLSCFLSCSSLCCGSLFNTQLKALRNDVQL